MPNSEKKESKAHNNSFNVFLFFSSFVAIAMFSTPVFADGFIFVRHMHEGWELGEETEQKAIINYEDGLQKMVLQIGLTQEQNKDAVWIFPVPSLPDKVYIDVTAKLPEFEGTDIIGKAKGSIEAIAYGLLSTQIVPIAPIYLVSSAMMSIGSGMHDVEVHKRVVKGGITTEVITAQTGSNIRQYLSSLGLSVNESMVPVLDQYIGKKASFVVSWISGDNKPNASGICVAFPTEKIYFPLIPTSIYGEKVVPATIYVSGLVNPSVFDDISTHTEIDYLTMDYHDGRDPIDFCQNGKSFTKIHIKAPSKHFTEDLWISRVPPLKAVVAWLFSEMPLMMFILSLLFFSALTGVMSGIITIKEAREGFKGLMKYALIGLSNCLTIIGLIICIILVRTRQIPEEDLIGVAELEKKGYKVSRRGGNKGVFIILYCILFCAIVIMSFMGIYNFIGS